MIHNFVDVLDNDEFLPDPAETLVVIDADDFGDQGGRVTIAPGGTGLSL